LANTPEEWLPILAKRLDARYPRIMLLRSYANGNPPMPEMGANVRASWVAFQRKACTNYGGLAVESLANRMVPNGIRVGTTDDSVAVKTAYRIWRDNRLDVAIADAIRDVLTCSIGYLVVGVSAGEAVVSRELPEQCIAAPDPLRPWKARAFLKVWRDLDVGYDFAYVYTAGMRQMFSRKSMIDNKTLVTRAEGGWAAVSPPEVFTGDPPVVILERHAGVGLFEPHIPVIDRINLGKLHRLVITAMQAFRQRGIKGDLAKLDDDGNDINWAKVFEPAPGALWDLPEGTDVWESEQTDIRPLLEGETTDARDFAGVVRTPLSVFLPEGENQSAEGAAFAREQQVFQAKDEISRITVGISVALVHALRAEGVDLAGETVEVLWEPPHLSSQSEKYSAAAEAINVVSRKTIQRDILGMSPDQIAQDEADLAAQQLQAFTLAGAVSGNPV